MHLLNREYILKGIFLGLLLFGALQAGRQTDGAGAIVATVTLLTLAGLALALLVAAIQKLREGYRVGGRLPAFLLFLLLESPDLIYLGTVAGLVIGTFLVRSEGESRLWIATVVGG